MKWILAFLLFLNAGLAGYQYWLSTVPEQVVSQSVRPIHNNLGLNESQRARLTAAGQVSASDSSSKQLQCIRITGLVLDEDTTVVQSRLKALEVESEVAIEQQLLKSDFQVLLGPFVSREAARDYLSVISAQGIEGYVISSGDNANSLSLGVFSNNANAERRLSELPDLIFKPTVFKNDYFVESAIVEIGAASAEFVSDETLNSVLENFAEADFLRYSCN